MERTLNARFVYWGCGWCVIVRVGIVCHTVLLCVGHVQYVGDLQRTGKHVGY